MKIKSTALSLNVADTAASADFAIRHFGFTEEMSADGFVSLTHPDAGFNIVFLRTGLSTFKPESVAGPAGQGMLIAFVVDDVDTEFARIAEAGASTGHSTSRNAAANPASLQASRSSLGSAHAPEEP